MTTEEKKTVRPAEEPLKTGTPEDEKSVKDRILDHAWTQQVRKVLMAGVGAVVLAQEEIEEFVNKLVDKGEIGYKDARKLVEETFQSRRDQAKKGIDKLEKTIDERIEKILDRMNVATKKDVEAVQASLQRLAGQLDKALKAKS
ncbi:MAG: phasin family protein [Planctomycetes bacterium]|nr:phasin family protein [Planctomycetota bacterium]